MDKDHDSNRRRNDENGTYVEEYPASAFIDVLDDNPKGTQEVADEVGCGWATAYRRLNSLDADGRINGTKIGNSYVWTVNDA